MLNLQEVENTITELENGETTLESCRRLAMLYIVRDHQKNANTSVSDACSAIVAEEIRDTLPMHKEYCQVKREFQLGSVREEVVVSKLSLLCEEIEEFIKTLYYNTNTQAERDCLHRVFQNVVTLSESVF